MKFFLTTMSEILAYSIVILGLYLFGYYRGYHAVNTVIVERHICDVKVPEIGTKVEIIKKYNV